MLLCSYKFRSWFIVHCWECASVVVCCGSTYMLLCSCELPDSCPVYWRFSKAAQPVGAVYEC
jgi:hypothetical protein